MIYKAKQDSGWLMLYVRQKGSDMKDTKKDSTVGINTFFSHKSHNISTTFLHKWLDSSANFHRMDVGGATEGQEADSSESEQVTRVLE